MAAKTKKPAKTQSAVNAERVRMALLARANAIAGLTPEILASHLEEFDRGYLRQAARVWQKIRDRDDQVKTVAGKREMAASLLDWEILTADASPEAAAQKEALDYFYENLTATDALDENKRGGVSTLIAQMLDAVGKKYAVHEIVWQPVPDSVGKSLYESASGPTNPNPKSQTDSGAGAPHITAELRFVPLWFFNNTTARLRYMTSEADITGVELEDGGWVVTVGAGLMEATSIAYLFKRLPLSSWLNFCEKFGIPGLHGKTDARKGSDEWNAMLEAIANFGQDWAILTNTSASINPIEVKNTGGLPHPDLVDRMDRAIARLWRGGDLSTMSKEGSAIGSQPQDKEAHKIEAADALLVSETLHHYVDTHVLRYCFGENVEAKAYFKLKPTVDFDAKQELQIDDMLIKWGVPRGIRDLLERYGRPEIAADDEPALGSAGVPPADEGRPDPRQNPGLPAPLANEPSPLWQGAGRTLSAGGTPALPFKLSAAASVSAARRAALAPILHRLLALSRIADPDAQRAALEQFHADLPALQRAVLAAAPGMAKTLENILGAAMVDGACRGTGSLPVDGEAAGLRGTGSLPVALPNEQPRVGSGVRAGGQFMSPDGAGGGGGSPAASKTREKLPKRVSSLDAQRRLRANNGHGEDIAAQDIDPATGKPRVINFGRAMVAHNQSDGLKYHERYEYLDQAQATVRLGKMTEQANPSGRQVRYYGYVFDDGSKKGHGVLVLVGVKNNEAFSVFYRDAGKLKFEGLANQMARPSQNISDEQPPESVIRAIVAAYMGAADCPHHRKPSLPSQPKK